MHRGISGGQKKRVTTGANCSFLKKNLASCISCYGLELKRLLLLLLVLWNMNLEMNNIQNGL